LRPIHWWFFWWEGIIPSVYRVVAVAVGAAITVTVVGLTTRMGWFVAVPLATVGWIVLAVIQDHDQGVHLDVNGEFGNLLRDQADPVLATAGFTFNSADGPCRARRSRSDTFLYEAGDPTGNGCVDLWIRRDRSGGQMEVSVDGHPLESLVASHGDPHLATRVTRAEGPAGDVVALVAAFELVLANRSH
jgi:hypothetical protein